MDSMKKKSKVMVIEDDCILLDSYRYYFSVFDAFKLIGAYPSVIEALKDYKQIQPDIIITDISMPGINGIEGLKHFKKLYPEVKTIVVSVHDDLEHILGSITNNADGYLTKPINKTSLLNALETVTNNGAPLSNDVSKKILQTFQKKKNAMFSDREHEIIDLFTKGLTYKDMADKLCVTSSTINFHIQNIYTKLDVSSKSEALKKLSAIL